MQSGLSLWQHGVSLPDDGIKALAAGLDTEVIKQHASHLTNPFDYIPAMHSKIVRLLAESRNRPVRHGRHVQR